jgi:hypothetical protein
MNYNNYTPELSFGDGTMLVSSKITGEYIIVSCEDFYNRKGAI